jgi:hypothetical protein
MKQLFQIIFTITVTTCVGQSTLTDPTSGCKFVLPWPCDECTMTWTGSCIDSVPNGNGVLTARYASEEIMTYNGHMKNGLFHGLGSYKDGMSEMEGYFMNGHFFSKDSTIWSNYQNQQLDKVHLNGSDGSNNLYLTISRPDGVYKGYMFLIPSFYESPEHVLEQTDLPIVAAKQGIMTIIPTFQTGLASFGIDSLTQHSFKEIMEDVHQRFNLENSSFYLGGFSIGGSCAVKFAEDAVRDNYQYQPDAIFVVDPPLDFIRFYNSMKRILRIDPNSKLQKEALYMTERIEKELNGTPITNTQNYIDRSPYCFTDTNQTAIKYLIDVPIRYYTEPELHWKMEYFGSADYSDINGLDGSCMINELGLLGNKNAELILTKDKGYRRPNHRKQPHSWSIIDDNELIEWLQNFK